MTVPVIREEEIHISRSGETDVHVSLDPMRGIYDDPQPFYIASIQEHLRSLAQSAAQFTSQLEGLVKTQINLRKERLLRDAGMTAAIGLPMKKRPDAPTTYTIPVNRRAPRIEQLKVTESLKPEPALADKDYQEILRIMSNMVQVSPKAICVLHTGGTLDAHLLLGTRMAAAEK